MNSKATSLPTQMGLQLLLQSTNAYALPGAKLQTGLGYQNPKREPWYMIGLGTIKCLG